MTIRTSAAVAGWMLLLYIVAGVTSLVISPGGADPTARLAALAASPVRAHASVLLSLLVCVVAFTLAVTLYAITRAQDRVVALLGLCFRAAESFFAAPAAILSLSLLWLASRPPQPEMAGMLLQVSGWSTTVAAFLFAVGSTLFCWLFLRGRLIPRGLAWLGLAASVLLVVALPLALVGIVRGMLAQLVWLPMLAFEVPLGIWLIARGVREPDVHASHGDVLPP